MCSGFRWVVMHNKYFTKRCAIRQQFGRYNNRNDSISHRLSVKLHLRHKRTNARNGISCILALKCDIWWQYFNDFPDNQLTKFRIFIGYSGFLSPPPLKFLWSIAICPATGWTHLPDRHNGHAVRQTDKQKTGVSLSVCLFVRLCLRWSLTPTVSIGRILRQVYECIAHI